MTDTRTPLIDKIGLSIPTVGGGMILGDSIGGGIFAIMGALIGLWLAIKTFK